jgi:DNA-binding NarL/FixJ family response regulator
MLLKYSILLKHLNIFVESQIYCAKTHNHKMPEPLKILIVEDHKILCESLALLVGTIDGVEVIGKTANGRDALLFLEKQIPDLIMTDIGMPIMNGIELTLKVRALYPAIKMLVLSVSEEGETIKDALRAGAMGYIFKSAEKEELEAAIFNLAKGKRYYNDLAMDKLAEIQHEEMANELPKVELSQREIEVLKLIVAEMSGTEIAEKLFISPSTVETHRKHLFQKIGVNSSVGLVKFAIKFGII